MEWLSDDDGNQWQCDFCIENNLQEARNCEGIEGHWFATKVFDHVFTQCPLKSLDSDSLEITQFCLLCEGGGMSVSRLLPSQALEETAYFWTVRGVILSEQRRIEKMRDKKREK